MNLQVSASYQPSEDEVWVDFRSTQDDLTTVSIADQLELNLLIESKDLIGTVSYIPIANLKTDSAYLRPDRNYEVRFRNPERKMDLWLEAKATYGPMTFIKRVEVGEALSSHNSMDLPDNAIFEQDLLTTPQTGGNELGSTPNPNVVVLAEPLRDFVTLYDFTTAQAAEDYEGLVYLGGGERLLLQNQTNQFELQTVDQAPWLLNSFLFLEGAGSNLLPNGFFENLTGNVPTGYKADAAGTIFQSSVDFNYQISAAAKLWVMRFTQPNGFSAFNEVSFQPLANVAVTAGSDYTISAYTKIRALNRTTNVTKYTILARWFQGTTLLSENSEVLDPNAFAQLNLASATFTAPVNADQMLVVMKLGSVDAADDVELSILGFQVEAGKYLTTRMRGSRIQDEVTIDPYDAMNQKIRLQMIAGFQSGLVDQQIISGAISVTFKATGDLEVIIPTQATLDTPFAFAPNDLIDLTVEHQSGKRVAIFRDGQLLAETPLPTFAATPSPLTILGVGVELMKLSVFSRRGS